jgi:alcohol dehydrogenase, propanol-preferring
MMAARIHRGVSDGKLHIEEIDRPKPGAADVLIKTHAAGVCHTDLHFLDGLIPIVSESMTLGHEISGEIVEVGHEVTSARKGQRVIVNNCVPCNSCPQCLEGRDNLCDNLTQLGFNVDGGYAEYVSVRADSAIPLPDSIPYTVGAALTCGVASCYHALMDIAKLTSKDSILIDGMGGLGFSALQIAKNAGAATTIVADVVQEKLDKASNEFGADYAINGRREKVADKVKEITNGKGVSIVIEFVGIKETMNYLVDTLSKTGRVVFVGYSKADFQINPLWLILKEARVLSSLAYRKSNLIAVRDLTSKGRIKPLIAGTYGLAQLNEALTELKSGLTIGRPMIVFS